PRHGRGRCRPGRPLRAAVQRHQRGERAMTLDDSATVLADIQTPADLSAALRARAEELQATREGIDMLGGLPTGYTSKLLSPVPAKTLGATSLPVLLTTLACRLVLIADGSPEAEAMLRRLPRRARPLTPHWRSSLAALARKGGRARAAALTPERRSA